MADDPDAAETEAGPSNTELAARVDGIESKLDLVLDKLGGAKDQAHATAQEHTENRLDRPTTVAEEIRAQLAARDAKDKDAAEKQGTADRLAAVEARTAELTEKTPESPVRRIEAFMGWRG